MGFCGIKKVWERGKRRNKKLISLFGYRVLGFAGVTEGEDGSRRRFGFRFRFG